MLFDVGIKCIYIYMYDVVDVWVGVVWCYGRMWVFFVVSFLIMWLKCICVMVCLFDWVNSMFVLCLLGKRIGVLIGVVFLILIVIRFFFNLVLCFIWVVIFCLI